MKSKLAIIIVVIIVVIAAGASFAFSSNNQTQHIQQVTTQTTPKKFNVSLSESVGMSTGQP